MSYCCILISLYPKQEETAVKKYLFLVTERYGFSILRPLQDAILRRNGHVMWFFDKPGLSEFLLPGEEELRTAAEVVDYDPFAVFTAGNHMYHFFPGIKVQVFHGYAMNKRADKVDDHFTIRGWFDIYCTQGPSSTEYFKMLAERHGSFKIYETGWCKVDPFFSSGPEEPRKRPAILYAPTFTRGITSAYDIFETIEELIRRKDWDWIITFHPKLDDPELIGRYRSLSEKYGNVTYHRTNDGLNTFRKVDVMLCDSSSIIIEVQMLGKPVVTFRNTMPGPHLIDVRDTAEIEGALKLALTRPPELMEAISAYTMQHEVHREGKNSDNILDAVDDFAANWHGKLKKKNILLSRRIKARRKLRYFKRIDKR